MLDITLGRVLWAMFLAFAWVLKFIFWLPVLTIYLADERFVRKERPGLVVDIVIGWGFFILVPLFAIESDWSWRVTLIVSEISNLLFGLAILFRGDGHKALKRHSA